MQSFLKAKDGKFIDEVAKALYQRSTIDTNKEIGTAHMTPYALFENRLSPRVRISAQEIKARTGRVKVRESLYNQYLVDLNKKPGITARKVTETEIEVTYEPVRDISNAFKSVSALHQSNIKDLAADPTLEENPF